jgi:hypothetical protein
MTPELIVLLCILSFLFGLACGAALLQYMVNSAATSAKQRRLHPSEHWTPRGLDELPSMGLKTIEERRRHNDG